MLDTIIAVLVIAVPGGIWLGILQNKVTTLEKSMDKNDKKTDEARDSAVLSKGVLDALTEIKGDVKAIKSDVDQLKIDVALLKVGK